MSRLVSFYVLIAIIIALGLVVYRVLSAFLVPMFMACLLVVMFRPMHRKILERCDNRHHLAAGLSTTAILLIVLVPGTAVVTLAGIEGTAVVRQLDGTKFRNALIRLRDRTGLTMPQAEPLRVFRKHLLQLIEEASRDTSKVTDSARLWMLTSEFESLSESLEKETGIASSWPQSILELLYEERENPAKSNGEFRSRLRTIEDEFRQYREFMLGGSYRVSLIEMLNPDEEELRRVSTETVSNVVKQSWVKVGKDMATIVGKLVLGLVLTVVGTFFFFADGPVMIRTIMRLSPLDDRYEQELLSEFDRISRAVVVATLLSAVVQGLLAGLGFWVAGVGSVFLLILLTTLLALIPFVGAAAVWVPAAAWLYFMEARTGAAISLAIYGAAVVSTADNVIKPLVLHGQSRLHPLLALLSVLGGVQALGPIGILVGPMVVVFLQTLLNILHREISSIESQPRTAAVAGEGSAPRPDAVARTVRRQRRKRKRL